MIKKLISCGAVVWNEFEDGIKILLVNFYPYGSNGRLIWGFTKGKMEENETQVETAIREIKEEANVNVEIDTNFKEIINYTFKIEGKEVHKSVVYFAAKAKNFKVHPKWGEIESCKWCDFEEAENLLTHESDRSVARKFRDYIND